MTAQRCRLTPLKITLFFKARLLCSVMIFSGACPKCMQAQSIESNVDRSQWHIANLSGSLAFLMPSFIPRLSVWGYGGIQGTLNSEQAACGILGIEPQYHLGKIKVFGSGQFLTKTFGVQNNHYPCGQISLGGDFFNWVQLRATLRKPFIGKSANEQTLSEPMRACISECLAAGWILKRFGLYGLSLWGGSDAWKDIAKIPKQIGLGLQCFRFLDISAICYLNGSLQSLVKKSSYGLRISLIGAFGRDKKYPLSSPYMLRFGYSMGTYFERNEEGSILEDREIELEMRRETAQKKDEIEDLTASTACEYFDIASAYSSMEVDQYSRQFSIDSLEHDFCKTMSKKEFHDEMDEYSDSLSTDDDALSDDNNRINFQRNEESENDLSQAFQDSMGRSDSFFLAPIIQKNSESRKELSFENTELGLISQHRSENSLVPVQRTPLEKEEQSTSRSNSDPILDEDTDKILFGQNQAINSQECLSDRGACLPPLISSDLREDEVTDKPFSGINRGGNIQPLSEKSAPLAPITSSEAIWDEVTHKMFHPSHQDQPLPPTPPNQKRNEANEHSSEILPLSSQFASPSQKKGGWSLGRLKNPARKRDPNKSLVVVTSLQQTPQVNADSNAEHSILSGKSRMNPPVSRKKTSKNNRLFLDYDFQQLKSLNKTS